MVDIKGAAREQRRSPWVHHFWETRFFECRFEIMNVRSLAHSLEFTIMHFAESRFEIARMRSAESQFEIARTRPWHVCLKSGNVLSGAAFSNI